MAWWEASLVPVPREALETLCARLLAAGASGFQEESATGEPLPYQQPWDDGLPPPPPDQVKLTVWFEGTKPPSIDSLLPQGATCTFSEVVEIDWQQAWRDSVQPLEISNDLVISPPWAAGPNDLRIEPGLGFGTGEHPSTRGALDALVAMGRPGDRVLDVGCGSGILALAAVHLRMYAVGIDIAEDAIGAAQHNAALNHMTVPFSTTPLCDVTDTFDVVLANIHAEAIVTLWHDLSRCTERDLILAGVLSDREPLITPLIEDTFETVHRHLDGPWVTLTLRRR